MVWTVQEREEGSLLEAAVRRIRLEQPENAWGMRWVEGEAIGSWRDVEVFEAGGQGGMKKVTAGGGMWAAVELKDAAVVINPIARRLVEQMRERGVEVEWVQQSLERWQYEEVEDGSKRQKVVRQISVDLVLSVAERGARRKYWWVEMKWTRGCETNGELRVVKEGWKKVEEFQKIFKELT